MLRHSSNSQTPFARGAGAWFHDTLYLVASFAVWNWRKSRYRSSRGAMRCPCQSLSDSGRSGESRCEASYYLKDPRRFSIVCPALQNTPVGLRCHHRLEDVRPYWGRAIFAATIAVVILYSLGATTLFGIFRTQGMTTVRWVDCSWPGNWSNLAIARAAHHRSAAEQSLAHGDTHAAIRSLSRAVNAHPEKWRNALLLAELYESIGQFAASEEIFGSLAQKHPNQIEPITTAHHNAVIASQRFDSLQTLAFKRLLHGQPTDAENWFRTLLVATMYSEHPSSIWTQYATACDQLEADHRKLLSVIAPPPTSTSQAMVDQLLDHRFDQHPLIPLRWKLLQDAASFAEAKASLQQDASVLSTFEAEIARWIVDHSFTSRFVRTAEWEQIVSSATSSAELLQLCAASLDVDVLPSLNVIKSRIQDQDHQLAAVLWVTAAAGGDVDLTALMVTELESRGYANLPDINSENLRSNLASVFAIFSIPREIQYSLLLATRPLTTAAHFE